MKPESSPNDYFALWAEITYDEPNAVVTPMGKRLQEKWRGMEGSDYGERLMTIIAATEAECPGLWQAIAHAGRERLDEIEKNAMDSTVAELAAAEKMTSGPMRAARRNAAFDRYHAHRQRFGENPSLPRRCQTES